MVSLVHRLRVAGRGWRVAAWVLGVVCVLSGAAWLWSGWRYVWIGGEVNGVLIDEGQLCVTAVRKEWLDMLSVRELYAEGWRPTFVMEPGPPKHLRLVARGGPARWRWWGRPPGLRIFDNVMPGLTRVVCPLWAACLVCGAGAAGCVWMGRRARVRWAGWCARCGYDARGLAVCPECGEGRKSEGGRGGAGG